MATPKRQLQPQSAVSLVSCSPSQLQPQSAVSLVSCIPSQLYPWSTASLVNCIPSQLHPQSAASLVSCIPGQLYPWSAVSLVSCIPGQLQHQSAVSLVSCSPGQLYPQSAVSLVRCSPSQLYPQSAAALVSCIPGQLYPQSAASLVSYIPGQLHPQSAYICVSKCWYLRIQAIFEARTKHSARRNDSHWPEPSEVNRNRSDDMKQATLWPASRNILMVKLTEAIQKHHTGFPVLSGALPPRYSGSSDGWSTQKRQCEVPRREKSESISRLQDVAQWTGHVACVRQTHTKQSIM